MRGADLDMSTDGTNERGGQPPRTLFSLGREGTKKRQSGGDDAEGAIPPPPPPPPGAGDAGDAGGEHGEMHEALFCGSCGAGLDAGAAFCGECGTPVAYDLDEELA